MFLNSSQTSARSFSRSCLKVQYDSACSFPKDVGADGPCERSRSLGVLLHGPFRDGKLLEDRIGSQFLDVRIGMAQ